jgi:hypothetical protein
MHRRKINLIINEEYNNNQNHERHKYFWVNNLGKNPMWENSFFNLWILLLCNRNNIEISYKWIDPAND